MKQPFTLEKTFASRVAFAAADWAYDWLPLWLSWALLLPGLLLLIVTACTEYVLRWLLTPRKFWDAS